MPRRGLDREQVVDAAVAIADADGLEAVTLARVAAELGVRSPSLYNHVDGHGGLLAAVAVRSMRELASSLRRAATGRAGDDAIMAVAQAHRAYVLEHPARYAATVVVPTSASPEHRAAAEDSVDVVATVLGADGMEGDDVVHAVRALRSAVHGFATIEATGGFQVRVDTDASFRRMVEALASGIRG